MSLRPFRAAVFLCMTLIGVAAFAQTYTWQHFAGDPGGGGSIDGNGTSARVHLGNLARDRAGNLYFADTEANVIRRITPAGEVTTVAGFAGASGNWNSTDSFAAFNRPVGIAVDQNDNLLVADSWNSAIRKITPAGIVSTLVSGLASAQGVAVDKSNGIIYIADTNNHAIRKIAVNGTMTFLAGQPASPGSANGTGSVARFNQPTGLSVDTNGDIYVSDTGNSLIRRVTPAGVVTTVSSSGFGFADGVFGNARFNNPQQLSIATNRDIFIADLSNDRIRKVSAGIVTSPGLTDRPVGVVADDAGGAFASARYGIRYLTGSTMSLFAGLGYSGGFADGTGGDARFKGPYDADTDALGNIYVADANNCVIRKITPAGVVTSYAGTAGQCGSVDGIGAAVRFYGSIYGLDVDDLGNVYVAEGWSHVIRKVAPDGTVTTIAGTVDAAGHVNATGSAARFNVPHDIVVAPSGDVYVADMYNHVIRKIAPDGSVTTLAGSPGLAGTTNGTGSAARFYYPHGITYAGGELFVTTRIGGVRRVTLSGDVTTVNDVCGAGSWDIAWGIASDAAGALYVSDYANNVVRKIVRSGLNFCATNIGGVAGLRGSEDGTGTAARFGSPVGTAVAPDGTLYVVEQAWLGVRRGTPATLTATPTVPSSSGPAGTPVTLGVSGSDSDTWQWQIVRRPGASSGERLSSATDRNPVFTPDVAGLYTFLLTATGPSGVSMRRVSFTANCVTPPAPTISVTAGSNPSCAGQSVTLEASAGYTSWLWSNGATTRTITVSPSIQTGYNVRGYIGTCVSPSTNHLQTMRTATNTIAVSGTATMCAGGSGGTATATDTGTPASRQWGWRATTAGAITAIAGETNSTYALLANHFPGTGTYFLVSSVTSSCGATTVSNEVTVTINAVPSATVSASGPTTFCEGGSVTLEAPAGNTYLWSTGATTQSIAVAATGAYSVTVTNGAGCSAAAAPVNVTVNAIPPVPVITADGPTTFCEGGSVTLTAPDGYSYLWSNGATTRSINVAATGDHSVTVTSNGCSATSATTAVTVNANPAVPEIAASGPTTFCDGGTVTLTAPAGFSYLWSNGATTQSIDVTTTGSYSVTVTNANGCSAASTATAVTVNANPEATITADGPTTFCEGNSVTLTANAASSYLWSNGATTQSILVTAGGSYSVTTTNAQGCSSGSAATNVTVNALPTASISASGATTFCEGGSVTLTASAGASYLWSTGATSPSIDVTQSGIYSVTVTNESGCSTTSSPTTVTVNANPEATITPSGPTTFCEGNGVTLTASAAASYLWSNGATTQSIVITAAGSYSVTTTNAQGCSSGSAATNVTVNALPTATIGASGVTTFCEGGSVTLTASAGSSYLWSNGATSSSLNVTQSGSYSVTVTNENGCSTTSSATTVTVNANPAATISVSGATTFCEGGSVTLTASAGSSYLWSTGATTSSINVAQSGSYSVTVTNDGGCSTTSAATTVTVNANPVATISASGATTFCEGGSVTLTASEGSSYLWSTGATTSSINVTQSGSYSVTVTNADGCSTTSSATTVTVNANPAATIGASGPTTFCTGGSVTLAASAGSSYLWSTGATTSSIDVTQSGGYTVTVTNANGCSTTSAATNVTVNPKPATPAITPSGPTAFCPGGSVTLTAPAGYTYLWSTGATSSSIVVTTGGNYSVTVTNASGCSSTSTATVVTVNAATSISQHPQSITIPKNTATLLSVTASGTGTLTYQWYRGTSGNTSQPIAGATNSTYNTGTLSKGTYTYWVRVTGTCGVVNSTTATVRAN
jgi:hypothetical protein